VRDLPNTYADAPPTDIHSITTDEWMATLQFLTRTGQTCTPLRQEFILLSDVLGVSALVDAINNPQVGNSTESSVLGPFFTEDAPDSGSALAFAPFSLLRTTCVVNQGDSIAAEGTGEYMYVEGRILSTDGKPISDAVIETWETDENGELPLPSLNTSCANSPSRQVSTTCNT
jgi:protocatechuate 3,4-dioxygenase beta subunit